MPATLSFLFKNLNKHKNPKMDMPMLLPTSISTGCLPTTLNGVSKKKLGCLEQTSRL